MNSNVTFPIGPTVLCILQISFDCGFAGLLLSHLGGAVDSVQLSHK